MALGLATVLVFPPLPAGGGGGGGDVLERRWLLNDPLGSTAVVLASDGLAEREVLYTPFGAVASEASATAGTFARFAGHRLEPSTGLFYMKARWYSPASGTFLSVDPLVPNAGDPQSYNGYAYGRNNPLSFADPTGTIWEWIQPAEGGGWQLVGFEDGMPTFMNFGDSSGGGGFSFANIPWTAYMDGKLIDAVASQFVAGQAHVIWAMTESLSGGAPGAQSQSRYEGGGPYLFEYADGSPAEAFDPSSPFHPENEAQFGRYQGPFDSEKLATAAVRDAMLKYPNLLKAGELATEVVPDASGKSWFRPLRYYPPDGAGNLGSFHYRVAYVPGSTAFVHSHPFASGFSPTDLNLYQRSGVPGRLVTPNGSIQRSP